MTLRWYEGAEDWAGPDYWGAAYQSGGSSAGSSTTARVPPGTRSIQNTAGNLLVTPSLSVQNTWFVGFALQGNAADDTVFSFRKAASEQCRLERVDQTGGIYKLRLMRGATQIYETTETFDSSIWHYFELQVTVRTGTNASYELRHNEVSLSSASSLNLAEAGSDGADVFGFAPAGLTDDVYILDDQGTTNNTFLGDCVVEAVLPDGDGATTDWTTSTGVDHYLLVDDPNTVANDTDYVQSDTNGHLDLFDYAALSSTGLGTIFGVQVSARSAMTAVGTRTLRSKFRSGGGTNANGPSFVVNGTAYSEYPTIMEENPVLAAAWTKSDIDAGQFGVEVVS